MTSGGRDAELQCAPQIAGGTKVATKITPFLMSAGSAEEAMRFHVGLFGNSSIGNVARYGPGEPGAEGSIQRADFTVAGQPLIAIDSPIQHEFTLTPSFSLFVGCESAEELNAAFAPLSSAGQVMMPPDSHGFSGTFRWVSDRFGVSWQLNQS